MKIAPLFCPKILCLALILTAVSALPLAAAEQKPAAAPADATLASTAAPDREITLLNIRYGGKIIWIPSPIIVKKGERVKLTLINNVSEDPNVHGYSIPQFNVSADVARGTPVVVSFTADKAGLFDTNCHLHPAHLHGQILVLEK
jgi:nitrosocyanin